MRPIPSSRRFLVAFVLLLAATIAASCGQEPPPPIQVRETDILIQNQTDAAWSGIEIWANDHFRGLYPDGLQAGQQLIVPLDGLVAAYGQRFDRHRQAVFGVVVKARASDGHDIRLTWGKVWKGR